VIVTTSSIAGQCTVEVRDRMAALCTHLFIDEAHHAEAPTWSAFKAGFRERRVLQFTATPFREDGRPLDGKIIFEYPLRKAQQEGYFRPIRFRRVVQFNQKRSDEAIAKTAIEQLKEDFDKGHILMARAENVAQAKEIFKIYDRYPEFKPVRAAYRHKVGARARNDPQTDPFGRVANCRLRGYARRRLRPPGIEDRGVP
jgi:superfamily II DNA or RNA helicase